jgi:hypothetical protein
MHPNIDTVLPSAEAVPAPVRSPNSESMVKKTEPKPTVPMPSRKTAGYVSTPAVSRR